MELTVLLCQVKERMVFVRSLNGPISLPQPFPQALMLTILLLNVFLGDPFLILNYIDTVLVMPITIPFKSIRKC